MLIIRIQAQRLLEVGPGFLVASSMKGGYATEPVPSSIAGVRDHDRMLSAPRFLQFALRNQYVTPELQQLGIVRGQSQSGIGGRQRFLFLVDHMECSGKQRMVPWLVGGQT